MLDVIRTQFRVLFFRADTETLHSLNVRHLAWGLAWTWLVGIGRWWDDPGAHLLQHMGLGSLIYVFVLAAWLWIVALPFRPTKWTYPQVLTLVTLTSMPAALYAIPIERWVSVEAAASVNAIFLLIVAVWRVSLLVSFLRRSACLPQWDTFLATAVPIMLIVTILSILNLERAVFQIMGGFRESTAGDLAYLILLLLTACSFYASWALVPAYLFTAYTVWRNRGRGMTVLGVSKLFGRTASESNSGQASSSITDE